MHRDVNEDGLALIYIDRYVDELSTLVVRTHRCAVILSMRSRALRRSKACEHIDRADIRYDILIIT
jgi:hypothetical protein